jgi:hypothetical protein
MSSEFNKREAIDGHDSGIKIRILLPMNNCSINLSISVTQIYHHDGIAYDYYSTTDVGLSKAADHWKVWPLPYEITPSYNQSLTIPVELSTSVISKLPYVDAIYVTTHPTLIDRHENLKKVFNRHGVSVESLQWRMKWNRTTCNDKANHAYVYQRLNLKDEPLSNDNKKKSSKHHSSSNNISLYSIR